MTKQTASQITEIRIDKWLWAARFFKSRSISHEAVSGGKVHLNGQRTKPSKSIRINDVLQIRQGNEDKIVVVKELSEKRVSASLARELYEETSESIRARATKKAELRIVSSSYSAPKRPNKKERRQLRDLRDKGFD